LDPEFLLRDSADERRSTMNAKRIIRITQLTFTAAVALTLSAYAEAKNHPSNKILVVRPADLPELARVPGQAMLLPRDR
jgi:hypothetical protein